MLVDHRDPWVNLSGSERGAERSGAMSGILEFTGVLRVATEAPYAKCKLGVDVGYRQIDKQMDSQRHCLKHLPTLGRGRNNVIHLCHIALW